MEYIQLFALLLWFRIAIFYAYESYWSFVFSAAAISYIFNQYIHTLIK